MHLKLRRVAPVLLATLVCLLVSANGYGATVDVSTLLTNASFETLGSINPGDVVPCPQGWTCGGSPSPGTTQYLVTNSQYAPGAIPPNKIVPDGAYAALCPTLIEGSCILSQAAAPSLGAASKYASGTTYTLNLYVGTPLTMPFKANGTSDNVTPATPIGRLTFYWTGNGGASLQATDITPPAPGKWVLVPLTFTPTGGQVGQSINIMIFAASSSNDQAVNFDIVPTTIVTGSTCKQLEIPIPAGAIDVDTLTTNPSFELPNAASGCPNGWTCGGSPSPGFTSYTVTAAQYAAGLDGLGLTTLIVPDGTAAATTPTFVEGSGIISQTNLGTYAAGQMYVVDLFVGTPKTMPFNVSGTPDNVTPATPVNRLTFYWLGTGGAALTGADITPPAPGIWTPVQFAITPTGGQVGQKIGFMLFADSGGNDRAVNVDKCKP